MLYGQGLVTVAVPRENGFTQCFAEDRVLLKIEDQHLQIPRPLSQSCTAIR